MTSSNHTAQLELWREIVSKRNEETQPVTQYTNFIQKHFDELDSKGFIWSKESIFNIFLQLGLSGRPLGLLPLRDEIWQTCGLQGNEVPSKEVEKMVSNDALRHTTRSLGLMDLPFEVFEMILGTLDSMAAHEAEEIRNKKHLNMVKITGPGARQPYLTYLHKNSPILNVTQTFSLTSREIYQRCRPWLWRKLQFPTALPAPVDLWTDNLLVNHGSHVRSLSLLLSENCSRPYGEFARHDPFYDNLIVDSRDPESISPKNARDLIARCPNLSTLKFDSEHDEWGDNAGRTEKFLLDLLPLISNLKQLQHLHIMNFNLAAWREFPSRAVGSLPLLQTFVTHPPTRSEDQQEVGESSFGYRLSKLRYLSRLELWFNFNVNESWCLYDWPTTITHFGIGYCFVSPSSVHRIIQYIAPYLTKLELDFSDLEFEGRFGLDSSENPEISFSLPFLTDLDLHRSNIRFRDCKSLRYLEGTCSTPEDCRALIRILSEGNWPQLKKLKVNVYFYSEVEIQTQEMKDQLVSLEKCRKQTNMKVVIFRPWGNPPMDVSDSGFDVSSKEVFINPDVKLTPFV